MKSRAFIKPMPIRRAFRNQTEKQHKQILNKGWRVIIKRRVKICEIVKIVVLMDLLN